MINKNNLIWIDLEMTGLNPIHHKILEIATVITDQNLNILSNGPIIAIHQPKKYILLMDKWNKENHKKSNLLNRVKKSNYNENMAEKEILKFIKKWVPFQTSPICGNTIYKDRSFLLKYMPNLENFFHYRNIDVSTMKELIKRWNKKNKKYNKKKKHIAILDIYDSIEELKYYKKNFIKICN